MVKIEKCCGTCTNFTGDEILQPVAHCLLKNKTVDASGGKNCDDYDMYIEPKD
jgi:hypothetical protein